MADINTECRQLIASIEQKQFSPIYLIYGEEEYYIEKIVKKLEEDVLTEAEKTFNFSVLYGSEVKSIDIVNAARRFPMNADRQLIIIKEAQSLNQDDALLKYLESPAPTSIVAFVMMGKSVDKRKKFFKLCAKYKIFEAKKLNAKQIGTWLGKYLKDVGKSMDPKAGALVVEYLGADLGKIKGEIDKLLMNIGETPIIKNHHIEEYIGISKDYNVFEFQKALGKRDFNTAVQIANYFANHQKNNPIQMVIGFLYGYYAKILVLQGLRTSNQFEISKKIGVPPFFVNDYQITAKNYTQAQIRACIGYLKYYDLRSKGVDDAGTDNGELIKEMTVRLLG